MDDMRLTITFSKQEVHPARASAISAELRDEQSLKSWDERAVEVADRYAILILGPDCLVRVSGMAREYLPKNGGEWQTVKAPVVYR